MEHPSELSILAILMLDPGYAYVTPDGKYLYVLIKGVLVKFEGEFSGMDEMQINEWLVDYFNV